MDPIPLLENALQLSLIALNHDKTNETFLAIQTYLRTISVLDHAVSVLSKRRSSTVAVDLIIEKKCKYSQRITRLEQVCGSGYYATYNVNLPSLVGERQVAPFVDYQTSFLSTIIPMATSWVPYDNQLGIFDRFDRIAQSIKTGAFVTESLYISPHIWSQTKLRFEHAEAKQTTLQMLDKGLMKIAQYQSLYPQINNMQKFNAVMTDFAQEMDGVRQFTLKKLKLGDESDLQSFASWSKLSFFGGKKVRKDLDIEYQLSPSCFAMSRVVL